MELFDVKGCLSEEGLQALVGGQLDETQRLEAAEHLAYCDRCMDRYTALLTDDVLEQPPRSARGAVMGTIWIRLMQNTWGRAAARLCGRPPKTVEAQVYRAKKMLAQQILQNDRVPCERRSVHGTV